jgi:hypothetical protein
MNNIHCAPYRFCRKPAICDEKAADLAAFPDSYRHQLPTGVEIHTLQTII